MSHYTRACMLLIALAPAIIDASERVMVHSGEPFTLRVGEHAAVRGTTLVVGFERVVSDSRCPEGVQCITAGDVAVSMWVRSGNRTMKLELRAAESPAAPYERHVIRLLAVEPRAREHRKLAPRDYRLRLQVDEAQQGRP